MRREHPLWRGFWLACLWAALLLPGGVDWLAAYRGERYALILAAAVAAGAGLAALIALLRRRQRMTRPRPMRMLTCFLYGAAMALACGMAGTGRILPALLEGSTGACAFAGTAAVSACLTARLTRQEVDA
ncbi:MAG: hypothetical protein IJE07_08185 [Clostridia bacterium]|nr:hypothetical protein [Clostridia bacterium]